MSPQPSSLKGSTPPRRSGILTRALKACAQVAGRLVGRIAKRITGCITRLARNAARPLALALALTAAATLTPAQAKEVTFPQLGTAACNSNVKYDVGPSDATVTGLGNRSNYKVIWDSFDLYPRANNSLHFAVDSQNKQPEVSFLNIVKGGQRSLIMGDIDTVSSAGHDINFYLINPNGITLYGDITGFKQVYLGTEQVSSELLKLADTSASALSINDLKLSNQFTREELDLESGEFAPGMGKVRLLGRIATDNLVVNGSQIIIGNFNNLMLSDPSGGTVSGGLPERFELHSSTNRIDIGGELDAKVNGSGFTFREYLKENGLRAAEGAEATLRSSLNEGEFIDHSGQVAIASEGFYSNSVDWSHPKFWLVDNLDLDATGYEELQAELAAYGLTGLELDGAFNTIRYEGEITGSGSYGLFPELKDATISNLKIADSELYLSSDLTFTGNLDLSIGALAGKMSNTTLHNVEVKDFYFRAGRNLDPSYVGTIEVGGLAGQIDGANKFTNVSANLSSASMEAIDQALYRDHITYGHLAGWVQGSLDQRGLVVAPIGPDTIAPAVGARDAAATGWDIATSFEEAQAAAEVRQESDLVDLYYVGNSDGSELQLKGFLKPYFVHDFNFMYAGKDATHDYSALTDAVNEGFDLGAYFTLPDNFGQDYSDAGTYTFKLTDCTNDRFGENFYFTYSRADATWDQEAGAKPADFPERSEGLDGVGALVIHKKPIELVIKDQERHRKLWLKARLRRGYR